METLGQQLVRLNQRMLESCKDIYGLDMDAQVQQSALQLHVHAIQTLQQIPDELTPPTTPVPTLDPPSRPSKSTKRSLFEAAGANLPAVLDFPQWVQKVIRLAQSELTVYIAGLVSTALLALVDTHSKPA